ncbi:alpha/beta hydrolase, partial [Acinetobacter sp. ABNIH27]
PKIGHMGYFRSDSKVLWDNVVTAFERIL